MVSVGVGMVMGAVDVMVAAVLMRVLMAGVCFCGSDAFDMMVMALLR